MRLDSMGDTGRMRARPLLAVALVAGLLHSASAFAQIQLVPVATGLTNPVFVTGARDGTRRLFIVEQAGRIRVMPTGGGATPVFLDIRSRVRAGGEQGLLGLAFHPSYASNRRFFVYYTRAADGAIVVAEYAASLANPDTADTTERVLLTIPHPSFSNHNGGMVAFGPDGYLYIGVGDGGSGNDPPNNAQNKNVLLGKLLRIDVDRQSGSLSYAIPLSNPFAGLIDGRDEVFAYGLRNPWRFAFDRQTSQLWIADVGQGDREEVNTPIQHGGNYGWRVFEGSACTNTDRAREDDEGEIYVVALDGVVSRIAGTGTGDAVCTPNVSPTQLVVRRGGDTATISVTAPAGCAWTATASVEWITFPSGATGAGSGTLTVTIQPRSWLIPRFGVITVAGRTVIVIQS